jgi:hypothetical protein
MFHRVRPAIRSLVSDRVAASGQDGETAGPEQIAAALCDESAAEVVATIRRLLADKQQTTAISVATAIGGPHGALAAGIIAGRRDFNGLAWSLLKDQSPEIWSRLAPDEYVRAGMETDRKATLAALRSLVQNPPATVPAGSWLALLGPVFGYREAELARALFQRLDRAVDDGTGIDRDLVWQRDWLRDWVAGPADAIGCDRAQGTVASFAILDYRHPDRFRASANIGDHVQSLAALGHVVRHQNLTFTGPDELTDLAERLQQRVRPEIRRAELEGTIGLHLAQRDASQCDVLPVDTWALAFGWYMHPQYQVRCDFPFHQNLRPIFVSCHISRRQLLTPQAIEYLQRYGPIGCRDWTTVDLLLSAGVDAFFSGCLTTTVSNVFPHTDRGPAAEAPWAYIDTRPPEDAENFVLGHQRRLDIRTRPFVRNVDDATAMLDSWRSEYAGITTSRLHVYLPARSIGATIDFAPKNPADPRFAGLAPLDDAGFDAIRTKINTSLETVLGAALSGAPVEQVYDLWRRLTADDVAAAKARLARPVAIAAPSYDLAKVIGAAPPLPAGLTDETVHIAVRVNARHPQLLRVLLSSVAEHSSRPVHARIVTRAPEAFAVDDLEADFAGLKVSVVDTRDFGGRLTKPGGGWLGPAEVDKFLTPELLPGVDRLDQLLAAARPQGTRHTSGYTVLLGAAQRLKQQVERSEELRRIVHQRHGYDFYRFKTDVLVINTRRWRDDAVFAGCVRWAENFGLDFREALHAEVGPEHTELDPRWHRVPTQDADADAALVHWSEQPRPWTGEPAPLAEAWLAARQTMRDRTTR